MHELALMEGVVRALERTAEEKGLKRITKVKLVVGKFTAALPDCLRFCFSLLTEDSLLEGAELEIEETEVIGKCRVCGGEFEVAQSFRCPTCRSQQVDIVRGRELYVDYIEGE